MTNKKIGTDIMGVILPKFVENKTFEELMACPALPDSVESIKKLIDLYKSENVFIISRCPEFAEKGIMRWFDEHSFFMLTSFNRANIYFCREQSEKALIAKKLSLSHFIDDKISVLEYMTNVVPTRIQLISETESAERFKDMDIVTLKTWPLVLEYIAKN